MIDERCPTRGARRRDSRAEGRARTSRVVRKLQAEGWRASQETKAIVRWYFDVGRVEGVPVVRDVVIMSQQRSISRTSMRVTAQRVFAKQPGAWG